MLFAQWCRSDTFEIIKCESDKNIKNEKFIYKLWFQLILCFEFIIILGTRNTFIIAQKSFRM